MALASRSPEIGHITADWLQEVVNHFARLERSQDALAKALMAHVPRYVFEHAYDPSGHSLTVPPMSGQLEVIDRFLVVVPAGVTGALLQLGPSFFVPFSGAGVFGNRIQVLLNGASDVRLFTMTGAPTSASACYLFGTLLPVPLPTT